MKKTDILIAVIIFVIAGAFFGVNKYYSVKQSNNIYAEVYVKKEFYKKVLLSDGHSEEIKIKTGLGENIIRVHDNGVEIIESDCPDHICENTGFAKDAGQIIVCLPHQVVVEIKGNVDGEVD